MSIYKDRFRPAELARARDPATSHAAAKRVEEFADSHHAKILATLKVIGSGTFYRIAEVAVMEPQEVWRRLGELQKFKKIELTGTTMPGPSGRKCRVWRPTP